jgi:hypothetical protein
MDNLIFSILIKPSDHISNKKQKYFNREKDLTNIKRDYAEYCGADYTVFGDDDMYKSFCRDLKAKYKTTKFTDRELINFYKFKLLDVNSGMYDNVLYLDFDVILGDIKSNVFTQFNMQDDFVVCRMKADNRLGWWDKGKTETGYKILDKSYKDHWHFNTGIMGASKRVMTQLDFFSYLPSGLEKLDVLYEKGWPNLGYDNELMMSYVAEQTDVNWCHLDYDGQWHRVPNDDLKHDRYSIFLHLRATKDFYLIDEINPHLSN